MQRRSEPSPSLLTDAAAILLDEQNKRPCRKFLLTGEVCHSAPLLPRPSLPLPAPVPPPGPACQPGLLRPLQSLCPTLATILNPLGGLGVLAD